MSEAMIQCEGLTKRFGTFTAVDHVTLSVAKGSIFGFLGPNGSGKSTVIRMLCGILEPSEGTARVAGIDVVRETERLKGMIGYMSQKFSLYDELTVMENLVFYSLGMTLFITTHYMDEAERCSHVGYIHNSKLIVCGLPDELKRLPAVNPPATKRLDVTCEHVTVGLQAMRHFSGVRAATVFGQSMHLLVEQTVAE